MSVTLEHPSTVTQYRAHYNTRRYDMRVKSGIQEVNCYQIDPDNKRAMVVYCLLVLYNSL